MMFTGDHPAQTKIGMLKASGKNPCRRCVCYSSLQSGHYVYGNNRQQILDPPHRRSSDELFDTVRRWKRAPAGPAKESILQEGGISGESILWRLFHLYDFDIGLDLVFDVMHITSLNLFKTYISKLFSEMKEVGVNMEEVQQTCLAVSRVRPYELRQGRWPNNPIDLHTTYMAEENQLFVQWILPHVLNVVHGQISFERQQLGLLLVDISHYFFNHTRVHGWSARDIDVVKGMFHSWRVLSEELDGPNGAPLEHVAGACHILDDIVRFGPSELYWCYSYERLVSKFHKISTNKKEMEVSYIQYYSREIFTLVRKQLQVDGGGLSSQQRSMLSLHKQLIIPEGVFCDEIDNICCNLWHSKCVIEVSTIEKAYEIWNLLQKMSPNPCKRTVALKGILIRRKDTKSKNMPMDFQKYVLEYLRNMGILGDSNSHEFTPFMKEVKYVMLEGKLYKPDCDVIVERDSMDATPYKANIKRFFSHEFGGEIRVFFSATYYLHLQDEVDGRLVDKIDKITGMNLVLNSRMFPYSYTCIRPMEKLVCKFMKIPCPAHIGQEYSVAYGFGDYPRQDAMHYIV